MDYTPIFCKFRTLLPTLKEHYFLKFVNKRKILCDLIKNAAKNLEFILKISIDLVIIITVEHRTQSCFFVEQVTLRKIGRAYVLFFYFCELFGFHIYRHGGIPVSISSRLLHPLRPFQYTPSVLLLFPVYPTKSPPFTAYFLSF